MTTSGTFNFAPSAGEVVLNAFARIGVRRTELTQEHLANARTEANLLQLVWANKGVTLWAVDLQTINLVQGTATYSVPAETVMILDVYVTDSSGNNRTITPISRSEYAQLPDPAQQGSITSFWFDRLISPTISFWQVPDGTASSVSYYRYRQIQDANIANTPEVPVLWLDAFSAGLAHRLSRMYAPQMEAMRKADADEAYGIAATQGTEAVNIYIQPVLSGYFR